VFAEGTKEQTERYAPLSARSSKSSTNPSNGVDSNDRIAKRPRKPAADDDDDESTAASTTVRFAKEKKKRKKKKKKN
jgi:hypothetical protein